MPEITAEGIRYIKEGEEISLKSCGEQEGEVQIPDEIEGSPVTRLLPYAFAEKPVTEVVLPKGLKEAGKYVFYRCFQLRKLHFTDAWRDIGAGAFTGCRLQEIEIDFFQGEQSCLPFIAEEIRYGLCVTMRYHQGDGRVETARVVFPEHYEEAVENTPARILETHHHGSGGYYRQCFYNKALNYPEYDRLLPRAVAEEEEATVIDIAACRLLFPYRLTQEAKERYEAWLLAHMGEAGCRYVRRPDTEMLRFFGSAGYWSEESLGLAIECAAGEKKTDILSMLMEEKHRHFPKKKKVFDL